MDTFLLLLFWSTLYIIDFYVLPSNKFDHYEKQWNIFIGLQVREKMHQAYIALIELMLFHNNRYNLYRVSGLALLKLVLLLAQSGFKNCRWLINFDATLKFDAILMRIVFHCLSLCQYKCQNQSIISKTPFYIFFNS